MINDEMNTEEVMKPIPEYLAEKWEGILNIYKINPGAKPSGGDREMWLGDPPEVDFRKWLFGEDSTRRISRIIVDTDGDIVKKVIFKEEEGLNEEVQPSN